MRIHHIGLSLLISLILPRHIFAVDTLVPLFTVGGSGVVGVERKGDIALIITTDSGVILYRTFTNPDIPSVFLGTIDRSGSPNAEINDGHLFSPSTNPDHLYLIVNDPSYTSSAIDIYNLTTFNNQNWTSPQGYQPFTATNLQRVYTLSVNSVVSQIIIDSDHQLAYAIGPGYIGRLTLHNHSNFGILDSFSATFGGTGYVYPSLGRSAFYDSSDGALVIPSQYGNFAVLFNCSKPMYSSFSRKFDFSVGVNKVVKSGNILFAVQSNSAKIIAVNMTDGATKQVIPLASQFAPVRDMFIADGYIGYVQDSSSSGLCFVKRNSGTIEAFLTTDEGASTVTCWNLGTIAHTRRFNFWSYNVFLVGNFDSGFSFYNFVPVRTQLGLSNEFGSSRAIDSYGTLTGNVNVSAETIVYRVLTSSQVIPFSLRAWDTQRLAVANITYALSPNSNFGNRITVETSCVRNDGLWTQVLSNNRFPQSDIDNGCIRVNITEASASFLQTAEFRMEISNSFGSSKTVRVLFEPLFTDPVSSSAKSETKKSSSYSSSFTRPVVGGGDNLSTKSIISIVLHLPLYSIISIAAAIALFLIACMVKCFEQCSSYDDLDETETSKKQTYADTFATIQIDREIEGMGGQTQMSLTGSDYGTATVMNTYAPLAIPAFMQVNVRDFKLERKIAEGGAGIVYLAASEVPNEQFPGKVVIKIIKETAVNDPVMKSLFYQEVAVTKALGDHRNFVKILGYTDEPKSMILKFYELGTLDDLIDGKKQLSLTMDLIISLAIDIASGISEMHTRKMSHNDIKPDNVLIDRDSNGLFAVLSDFSLSSLHGADLAGVGQFKLVGIEGHTVNYGSPEMLNRHMTHDESDLDPEMAKASDIFSTGMSIYSMFTRTKPWSGVVKTADDIAPLVLKGKRPPFPSNISAMYPMDTTRCGKIRNIIERCWEHDYPARPDVNEVLHLLRAIEKMPVDRASTVRPRVNTQQTSRTTAQQ